MFPKFDATATLVGRTFVVGAVTGAAGDGLPAGSGVRCTGEAAADTYEVGGGADGGGTELGGSAAAGLASRACGGGTVVVACLAGGAGVGDTDVACTNGAGVGDVDVACITGVALIVDGLGGEGLPINSSPFLGLPRFFLFLSSMLSSSSSSSPFMTLPRPRPPLKPRRFIISSSEASYSLLSVGTLSPFITFPRHFFCGSSSSVSSDMRSAS